MDASHPAMSPTMRRNRCRSGAALVVSVCCAIFAFAQTANHGQIAGRVLNAASGGYLNHARVTLEGTNVQTLTNEDGEYRLAPVPVGEVTVRVTFTGFAPQSVAVRVSPGQVARQNFELALAAAEGAGPMGEAIRLGAFTVAERRLSGEAVALQEQRMAPNIKNVVALEEFPNFGEGGVGEYLQFLPGLNLAYNPQSPVAASIRGMPTSGTLVTMDGAALATGGGSGSVSRQYDFAVAMSGNIDRIEVTKTPTPDMPANAVGGGINLVSRGGFSRKNPLFTYNVFGTFTALDGHRDGGPVFARSRSVDGRTDVARVQPAADFTYIRPVNQSLAFTLAASKSSRFNDWEVLRMTWDKVRAVQTTNSMTATPLREEKEMVKAAVDWKIDDRQSLRANVQHARQVNALRQNSFIANLGANATGDATFSQGASAGVGSVQLGGGWNNQYKPSQQVALSYKFNGRLWTIDANASWSYASLDIRDITDGFVNNLSSNIANLVVRTERIDQLVHRRAAVITATDRAGVPVNFYDSGIYALNSITSNPFDIDNEVRDGAVNVKREFSGPVRFALKSGVAVNHSINDRKAGAKNWTFAPPGAATARLLGNYDVIAQGFSERGAFTDANDRPVQTRALSMAKLYDLFRANPGWFTLNEAAAHTSIAQQTQEVNETITAAYLRGDVRLVQNRWWIVGGVRFERTADEGRGLLSDLGAAYVRDAGGRIVRNAAGAPTFVTNDLLARARLQYQKLGATTERRYQGYYPSLNTSFAITDKIVVRAAFARTIGRPDYTEIIPGVTVADPAAAPGNRTVTIVNTGLKPWAANNYDLSFEAYQLKSTVATVSLFRKDLRDFFAQTRIPATAETLAEFNLPDEYLSYEIVTKRNAGAAAVTGVETGIKHSFNYLPPWARGVQVFFNITTMDLSGANADDLARFCPQIVNWGVSLARPKFSVRLAVMNKKWERTAPVAASATVRPSSYNYFAPLTKIDVSAEFRIARKLFLEASVRNLTGRGLVRGTWSPDTPYHARIDQDQFTGALFTLGIKGEF
ncbi:MAG: TonB-dependent receptor [Opitutus sp.]|nr:TonB-dependent receptor [Opitutus sp.]